MLINEIYDRIILFANLALNNPLIYVAQANQKAARKTKPFVTVAVGNMSTADGHIKYATNDDGLQPVCVQKSFVVTFNAFSDTLHDSENILNFLENALYTELAYDVFRSDIAAIKTVMGVTALPKDVSAEMESRAILEVMFRTNQEVISNVGKIEHIHIEDTTEGEEIIINT